MESSQGKKTSSFRDSVRFAWSGLARTLYRERNMKIHAVASIMVSVVGMSLHFDLASRAALLFSVALVWFAEILNSALESFVDLHVKEHNRLAMVAKDAAAAAVLVTATASVLILVDVLYTRWDEVRGNPEAVLWGVGFGVPLSAVVAVILFAPRRKFWVLAWGGMGVGLFVPLAARSANLVFTLLAAVILSAVLAARLKER